MLHSLVKTWYCPRPAGQGSAVTDPSVLLSSWSQSHDREDPGEPGKELCLSGLGSNNVNLSGICRWKGEKKWRSPTTWGPKGVSAVAVFVGTPETSHNMPTHIHCAKNTTQKLQQTDLLVEVSDSASREGSFCPLLSLAHLPVFVNMTWVTANEALRSLGLCEGRVGSTSPNTLCKPRTAPVFKSAFKPCS